MDFKGELGPAGLTERLVSFLFPLLSFHPADLENRGRRNDSPTILQQYGDFINLSFVLTVSSLERRGSSDAAQWDSQLLKYSGKKKLGCLCDCHFFLNT